MPPSEAQNADTVPGQVIDPLLKPRFDNAHAFADGVAVVSEVPRHGGMHDTTTFDAATCWMS